MNRLVRENYSYPTGIIVELRNVEDEKGKLKRGKKMMKTRIFSCRGGWSGATMKGAPCPQAESTEQSGRLSGEIYFRNYE